MPEPRRWTLHGPSADGMFDYRAFYEPTLAHGEVMEVVEAAPVEAQLDELNADLGRAAAGWSEALDRETELEVELDRLREEIASDEGSFREALTALKTVADQRDALSTAARDYRFAHPCENLRCEAAVALREALER